MPKKKLVILTGAGMSAESGFRTFRDSGGLWEQYAVEQVATPEGWEENPNLVTDFYNRLRKQLIAATPNEGHYLLADMEKKYDVRIITQNVDDFHERACSSNIIHLHGELMKVCSSAEPNNPLRIRTLDPDNPMVIAGEKASDGSLLRPWIVWFGEPVPRLEEAIQEVKKADYFVIIGSSLNVYPAASLVGYAPDSCKIFLIDPKEVSVPTDRPVVVIQETASKGIKILQKKLSVIGLR